MTNKSLPPNLANYDKTYASFTWELAETEVEWFPGHKINAAYNAIDRHCLTKRKDKTALIWVNQDKKTEFYSFADLAKLTNKFANLLISLGLKKQERVFIFMPRFPELYISFLGTVKAGCVAGTLFSAFGPEALRDRLKDGEATALVTVPELLPRVEAIIMELPHLKHIILVENRNCQSNKQATEVVNQNEAAKLKIKESLRSYENLMQQASDAFKAEPMKPIDYAFMLYTSGTTGKAKGVVHCHQAIVQEHITAKWVLDLKEEDVYWCTADPGWVTGIAYGILGSWSNGVTSVVYSGRFKAEDWYEIIDKFQVTVWYTAPTAIRMLMRDDDTVAKRFNLSRLRHLLSVGEPLNPEAIRWGQKVFGLSFHDSWWQTETGSILISNYRCLPIKLGSMGKPFPGIKAAIVDDAGKQLPPGVPGNLAIKPPWPSMMATIWKNEAKFKEYFKGGWYISGDKAYQDDDGYFWFIGRADDVIKTAGERVGPFEVESVLVEHPAIVEAGVIGKPDVVRGEIIKAFVVLKKGVKPSPELEEDIKKFVKKRLAGHAYPREFAFVASLPKTQSGKIMRRVLKAKELGLPIGDLSTLEKD